MCTLPCQEMYSHTYLSTKLSNSNTQSNSTNLIIIFMIPNFNTFLSTILNFDCINLIFLCITVWNPLIPMFMIVLTTTLSDFIAIFKKLMQLLENHNPISIHTAKCGRSMWSNRPSTLYIMYSYSPYSVKVLHKIPKH